MFRVAAWRRTALLGFDHFEELDLFELRTRAVLCRRVPYATHLPAVLVAALTRWQPHVVAVREREQHCLLLAAALAQAVWHV